MMAPNVELLPAVTPSVMPVRPTPAKAGVQAVGARECALDQLGEPVGEAELADLVVPEARK